MSDANLVSAEKLAAFLGVSVAKLNNLAKDQIVKKNSNGQYHFLDSVKGYIKHLQENSVLWTRTKIADHTGFNRNTLKSEFVKRDIFPTETGGTDTKPIDYYTVKQWGPIVYGGVDTSDDVEMSLKTKDELLKQKTFEEHRKLKRENDEAEARMLDVNEFIKVGAPIFGRLSDKLDRVGNIAASVCAEVDARGIEEINREIIPFKNEIASIADTLLTTGEDVSDRDVVAATD